MNIVASVPNLSKTVKSKLPQLLSCSNKQTVIISYTKEILFLRSMNFHRSKSLPRILSINCHIFIFISYCYKILLRASADLLYTERYPPLRLGDFLSVESAASKDSLLVHPSQLCLYHLDDLVCFVEWKCLLTALMRIREKACFAVSISGGGPNGPWHR